MILSSQLISRKLLCQAVNNDVWSHRLAISIHLNADLPLLCALILVCCCFFSGNCWHSPLPFLPAYIAFLKLSLHCIMICICVLMFLSYLLHSHYVITGTVGW